MSHFGHPYTIPCCGHVLIPHPTAVRTKWVNFWKAFKNHLKHLKYFLAQLWRDQFWAREGHPEMPSWGQGLEKMFMRRKIVYLNYIIGKVVMNIKCTEQVGRYSFKKLWSIIFIWFSIFHFNFKINNKYKLRSRHKNSEQPKFKLDMKLKNWIFLSMGAGKLRGRSSWNIPF